MFDLFSKSHWIKKRQESLLAARENRAALTNPEGYYCYATDDERVKAATEAWVERARHAHRVALGRIPAICDAVVINGQSAGRGSLYVR